MVETRTRILGIAPYEGMHAAMDRAAQAYPNVQMDVFTGDLDVGVSIVQRMPPNSYDCIISRGGTANLIRRVTELPVVEVPLSVYDVLSAMKLAENYSSRYAIVGFPSITEPAHTLCELLRYQLDIYTVHSAEEAADTLERIKGDGCRMVVCDMITHTIARKMELDAFLITSGVESVHAAIDQALDISLWFGRLRQENTFLRSITQDQNGRVVVLDMGGGIFYSSPAEPPSGLLEALRAHFVQRFHEILSYGAESALQHHSPDAFNGRGTVLPVLLRSLEDSATFPLDGDPFHEPGRMRVPVYEQLLQHQRRHGPDGRGNPDAGRRPAAGDDPRRGGDRKGADRPLPVSAQPPGQPAVCGDQL